MTLTANHRQCHFLLSVLLYIIYTRGAS